MTPRYLPRVLYCITAIITSISGSMVLAQSSERWYQVEITLFSQEHGNPSSEVWDLEQQDLSFPRNGKRIEPYSHEEPLLFEKDIQRLDAFVTVPVPQDPEALDAFVSLPASEQQFTRQNRALTAAGEYRVLYHDAWRQPMQTAARATPLVIATGRQFGEHYELEGSFTLHFNAPQDRIVLDTNLWFTQFSNQASTEIDAPSLPALPRILREETPGEEAVPGIGGTLPSRTFTAGTTRYYPSSITPVQLRREMRSNEIHYLDHPMVGILVQVFRYPP